MAMADASNAELLRLWKTGSQQAARILVERYMLRLTALARSRMSLKLSRRIDADDVVMSAWRSFFVAVSQSRLHTPDDDNLWPVLVTIALRKLHRQVQRHLAERRSIKREVTYEDDPIWQEIVSNEPTPEHAAQLTHDLETLMARLDPQDREILTRRLQGQELESIATEFVCSERTVRRAMQRIRSLLASHFDQSDSEFKMPTGPPRESQKHSARENNPVDAAQPADAIFHRTVSALSAADAKSGLRDTKPSFAYNDLILEKLIGQGGFGRVYRARLKKDERIVAVKFLKKRFWRNVTAVSALMEELLKASTIPHPGIIRHHGWGMAPSGGPFLVMDYIEGLDLREWIRSASFDTAEIITCARQLSDALQSLHGVGIIHGDIAPGNVLRRSAHDFVLTDFGLSRIVSDLRPCTGGTPGFLAPEQVSSAFGVMSERTDIYGLGAVLYFLATHRPPFIGNDTPDVLSQILSTRAAEPIPDTCEISLFLSQLIMSCLAKEPLQRGHDMRTVHQQANR